MGTKTSSTRRQIVHRQETNRYQGHIWHCLHLSCFSYTLKAKAAEEVELGEIESPSWKQPFPSFLAPSWSRRWSSSGFYLFGNIQKHHLFYSWWPCYCIPWPSCSTKTCLFSCGQHTKFCSSRSSAFSTLPFFMGHVPLITQVSLLLILCWLRFVRKSLQFYRESIFRGRDYCGMKN